MSPDDGMDLTYLLTEPHLCWVPGGGDLRNRFLCGDVVLGCSHVAEGWVGSAGGKVCSGQEWKEAEADTEQRSLLEHVWRDQLHADEGLESPKVVLPWSRAEDTEPGLEP